MACYKTIDRQEDRTRNHILRRIHHGQRQYGLAVWKEDRWLVYETDEYGWEAGDRHFYFTWRLLAKEWKRLCDSHDAAWYLK